MAPLVDTIQLLSSGTCRVNVGKQVGEGDCFSVPRHMPLTHFSQFVALNMRLMILKMQQRPQLKTGIGNSRFDFVVPGLLYGVGNKRMVVDIKYAPYLIVAEKRILPRLPSRLLLHLNSSFHHGLRRSGRNDFKFDLSSLGAAQFVEVSRLSLAPLAHDQNSRIRLPARRSAFQVAIARHQPRPYPRVLAQ